VTESDRKTTKNTECEVTCTSMQALLLLLRQRPVVATVFLIKKYDPDRKSRRETFQYFKKHHVRKACEGVKSQLRVFVTLLIEQFTFILVFGAVKSFR